MSSIDIYPVSSVIQSKTCSKCNISKILIEFSKRKKMKDGYNSKCKLCVTEYYKESHITNKERDNERSTKYHIKHPEYTKENHITNKNHNNIRSKQYNKVNISALNAYKAKYRASKLKATPFWIELNLIKQLYIDCKLMSEMTGITHHVDHIVPLQSEIVCGLHCISNLQIITAIENISKGNRHSI